MLPIHSTSKKYKHFQKMLPYLQLRPGTIKFKKLYPSIYIKCLYLLYHYIILLFTCFIAFVF